MTEKEIRRLNRKDLLILLAEQTLRADRLEEELKKIENERAERQLIQEECGTMAEAALKLTSIFAEADEAAKLYLENIRQMQEKQEIMIQKKADEILRSAYEKAEQIVEEAKKAAAISE